MAKINKTVTVSKEEFMDVIAKATTIMCVRNPARFLIADDFCELGVTIAHELFDEEEK